MIVGWVVEAVAGIADRPGVGAHLRRHIGIGRGIGAIAIVLDLAETPDCRAEVEADAQAAGGILVPVAVPGRQRNGCGASNR